MTGSYQFVAISGGVNMDQVRDKTLAYEKDGWEVYHVIQWAANAPIIDWLIAVHPEDDKSDPNGGFNESWR